MGRIRDAWAALTARETETPPEFRFHAGVHRHYKGGKYLAMGLAHDANVPGRTVVVYVGLDTDGAKAGARLAVRTLDETTQGSLHARPDVADSDAWLDEVDVLSQAAAYQTETRPRFAWIGPTYEPWMSER